MVAAVLVFSETFTSASLAKTGALLAGVVEVDPELDDELEPLPPELSASAAFAAPAAPQPDIIKGKKRSVPILSHLRVNVISRD